VSPAELRPQDETATAQHETATAQHETATAAGAALMGSSSRRRLGAGVIGFGWMGQAHARSLLRIPTLFGERAYDPVLIACADTTPERLRLARDSFGFARVDDAWQSVISDPEVEVVFISAPNMLHVELARAAAEAGKPVFCEKPVGGTPEQVREAAAAVAGAGVMSGVGYCYRWAPLVQYARELIASGQLGEITNYRGRFFSMYGADPFGLNSWRFQLDEAGYGVTSDLLSHAVDLALALIGPIDSVCGVAETFIRQRPLPVGAASHYGRGRPEDPHGPVTNEDYAALLCRFACGAHGTFEVSRTMVGPESEMAFDVYGTRGALSWNLERMNELRLYRATDEAGRGFTRVLGGERFPHHGAFAPGSGIGIGFEDLVAIEDHEFLSALCTGRPFEPSFEAARQFVEVQDALLRSIESGRWEEVA